MSVSPSPPPVLGRDEFEIDELQCGPDCSTSLDGAGRTEYGQHMVLTESFLLV